MNNIGHTSKTNPYDFYGNPVWDDYRVESFGRRLDTSRGTLDYDYTNLGILVSVSSSASVDRDAISCVVELPHDAYLGEGAVIRPHIHWIQESDVVPNWLLKYRIYEQGDDLNSVAWKSLAWSSLYATYNEGEVKAQMALFPEISIAHLNSVSANIDIKVFRDGDNSSGLFNGTDGAPTNVLLKFFDFHYLKDSIGSRGEYNKYNN